MNQGKPQIYGTQTITTKDRVLVVPLMYPERVDELRRQMDLEPLNEYMNDFGSSWSLDSYKKDLPEIEKAFNNWHATRQNITD